jgi:hypothetical protein
MSTARFRHTRTIAAALLGAVLSVAALAPPATQAATSVASPSSSTPCWEASCVPLGGTYISHFTAANCYGKESYYTPYFNSDGIRRSWDGQGMAGTILRTVTNRSWRDQYGDCHNSWPNGNTLSGFVTIYRYICHEQTCVHLGGAYISHFSGLNCTGLETYYTHYFNNDGIKRSWDGKGAAGTAKGTFTQRSWRDSNGICHNDWPNGLTGGGFVIIYRSTGS